MTLEEGERVLAHFKGHTGLWIGLAVFWFLVGLIGAGGGLSGFIIGGVTGGVLLVVGNRHRATLTDRRLLHTMFWTTSVPLRDVAAIAVKKKVLVVTTTAGKQHKLGPLQDVDDAKRVLDEYQQGITPAR